MAADNSSHIWGESTPSSINDGERSPTLPKYGWNYQLPYNAEFAAILTIAANSALYGS
jgi:hypothetical protein